MKHQIYVLPVPTVSSFRATQNVRVVLLLIRVIQKSRELRESGARMSRWRRYFHVASFERIRRAQTMVIQRPFRIIPCAKYTKKKRSYRPRSRNKLTRPFDTNFICLPLNGTPKYTPAHTYIYYLSLSGRTSRVPRRIFFRTFQQKLTREFSEKTFLLFAKILSRHRV